MLRQNKNAVIYGGGGAIGGAVARAFAREGARVFLAGRTRAKLEQVAREISAAGGMAEVAEVDALDEKGQMRFPKRWPHRTPREVFNGFAELAGTWIKQGRLTTGCSGRH
jgi:NAD(P)-dependent dehydrogenase (short-subunit alcohol dehydrogenase family)